MVSKRPPGHSIITIAITKVTSCPDLPGSERFPGIQDFWCWNQNSPGQTRGWLVNLSITVTTTTIINSIPMSTPLPPSSLPSSSQSPPLLPSLPLPPPSSSSPLSLSSPSQSFSSVSYWTLTMCKMLYMHGLISSLQSSKVRTES